MTNQNQHQETSDDTGLASRQAALSLLAQILGSKKMLDFALDNDSGFLSLPQRDRAFVRMMVTTILRRRGQLDDLIAKGLSKGEAPRPEKMLHILYIGICQILFMDVANHAAVDTSVELTALNNMDGKKAFVNAILRRMSVEGKTWVEAQDAAKLNIPPWIYDQWIADYGTVRAKDIAMASLAEAALDITIKKPSRKNEFGQKLEAVLLPTGTLRRPHGGTVTDFSGFEDGDWWVQDASSAIPAALFGDIEGKTVLDLCAAPGGKTMQLAAQGAKVVAVDRSASRMKSLSENLKRVGLSDNVTVVIEDGAVWKPKEKFDFVLLDAPCSATGTIRRHPDLLSLKSPKDQAGLEAIQERLLDNVINLLNVGGVLMYCTCSLQKAEGEHKVEKFLNTHTNFGRLPIRREEFGNIEGMVNADGEVRILPYHLKDAGGMDGFFIARLKRLS
jgi:16S rRNA (cytosine967-C5)-methyltransferase